jgi:predicted AAA+ superfamily ATPase
MMTAILGWDFKEVLLNADRSGKLAETFVFQELAAQIDLDSRCSLYHYRDRDKREIDFIVEREDGAMMGIEVKSGHNVVKRDFAQQEWFARNLARDKPFVGIVLFSGEDTLSFGENLLAVPIASFWSD